MLQLHNCEFSALWLVLPFIAGWMAWYAGFKAGRENGYAEGHTRGVRDGMQEVLARLDRYQKGGALRIKKNAVRSFAEVLRAELHEEGKEK